MNTFQYVITVVLIIDRIVQRYNLIGLAGQIRKDIQTALAQHRQITASTHVVDTLNRAEVTGVVGGNTPQS